jgi:hypothetical protein
VSKVIAGRKQRILYFVNFYLNSSVRAAPVVYHPIDTTAEAAACISSHHQRVVCTAGDVGDARRDAVQTTDEGITRDSPNPMATPLVCRTATCVCTRTVPVCKQDDYIQYHTGNDEVGSRTVVSRLWYRHEST